MTCRTYERPAMHLVTGAILVITGLFFLLANFHVLEIDEFWRYWPFILVFIGLGRFALSVGTPALGDGLWLAFIGLWLFVSLEHVWGLDFSDTWPLLIVAWGATLLGKALVRRQRTEEE